MAKYCKFTIKDDNLRRRFTTVKKRAERLTKEKHVELLELLLEICQREVHIDTGELLDSLYATETEFMSGKYVGSVVAPVIQALYEQKRGGSHDFLTLAISDFKPRLIRHIEQLIKDILK